MRKQKTHTLPIMCPPNRLRQRRTNIHNPQLALLLPSPQPLILITQRHRIRHNQCLQFTIINHLNRITTQYTMGDDGEDFFCAFADQGCGGFGERAAGIGHIVDEDAGFADYLSDEGHFGDFVGARAFFVDYGEGEVETVGYGCYATQSKKISCYPILKKRE